MAEVLTDEQKKKRFETIAKIVVAGAVCFAVSPIIFSVVQGMIGLIIAGVVGFTALQLTPWFAMKIANLRMKLIRDEAGRNPIETMNNVYKDNMETIRATDQKIVQFESRLGDYVSKMAVFTKQYPDEAEQFKNVSEKMTAVLTRMKQKQKAAKIQAKVFHDQIVKAEAIYEMACAAHEVTKLAGDAEKLVFEDIKKRVAFDSVTHSFNTAVAELSVEADTDPDSYLTATKDSPLLREVVETTSARQAAV